MKSKGTKSGTGQPVGGCRGLKAKAAAGEPGVEMTLVAGQGPVAETTCAARLAAVPAQVPRDPEVRQETAGEPWNVGGA
jgi:hypothetical protein